MTADLPQTMLPPILRARLVRYAELRPCTNAFIDARTPGSDQKENFTIIGPGVAENPHQYVHIRDPHGFNIGAARQPPRCTNSLHSHDSEEVFMIHQGTWRFFWGENGDAGSVLLRPGDTISIPVHVFRGFENVGKDTGFMFAILGGDDPGRVHWAPHVIEKARGFGLILLDNGNLVDTTLGEQIPAGSTVVSPSTPNEISYIRVPTAEEIRARVVHRDTLVATVPSTLAGGNAGVREFPIIGQSSAEDGVEAAPIAVSHGFTLRLLDLAADATTAVHTRSCKEVLLVQSGRAMWRNDDGAAVELRAGDTFTVPVGMARQLSAIEPTQLFVVLSGNSPGTLVVTA